MIPLEKVREIISKHKILEKQLSSNQVDRKKFAKISKEYSDLNEVLVFAKQYLDFERIKTDLEKILEDEKNNNEMKDLAKLELNELYKKKNIYEKKLKFFLLPKDDADTKNAILK